MARPKPRLKIKRNVNFTPTTQLTPGELGVDLGQNKLYVGNSTGTAAIPIAAAVSIDPALGGSTPSDNLIATEKAVKTYVSTLSAPPATSREIFIGTVGSNVLNSSSTLDVIDFSSMVFTQTPNMNLKLVDPVDPLVYGFFQDTKNEMYLNVNYSIHFQSISSNALSTEANALGYWRLAGLRLINTTTPTNNTYYYGMSTTAPVIGGIVANTASLPTLMSGNAVIRLPRYTPTTTWRLQLIYRIRSADSILNAGDVSSNTTDYRNDPVFGVGTAIRIQVTKLGEN